MCRRHCGQNTVSECIQHDMQGHALPATRYGGSARELLASEGPQGQLVARSRRALAGAQHGTAASTWRDMSRAQRTMQLRVRGGEAQPFGNREELRSCRAAPDARRVRVCTESDSPLQSP